METAARKALVVGINAYSRAPLQCCVSDATAVHGALIRMGFESVLKTDCDAETLRSATDQFCRSLNRGDIAVFYFAGHGAEACVLQAGKFQSSNWLLSTQVPASNRDLNLRAVDAHNLLAEMELQLTRFNVLILDCCRDDPLPAEVRGLGGRGLASMDPKGSVVAFSCARGQKAEEIPGQMHGIYTKHLLHHIETPGLAVVDLFIDVCKAVNEETKLSPQGPQNPYQNVALQIKGATLFPNAGGSYNGGGALG